MKCTFLILNYNSTALVKKLVDSIKNFEIVEHIIIVDNNSNKNEKKELNKINSKKIIKIFNEENNGYSSGNNIGLRYATKVLKSEIVVLANPDIEISENSLKKCVKYLKDNKNVAIVAPKIKNINSNYPIAWKTIGYLYELLSLFYISEKYVKRIMSYDDDYLNKIEVEVDVLPGSLMCFNMEIIEKIDFFDENTFLYYEENILAQKIKKNNYKSVILTDIEYIHQHGATTKKELKNYIQKYRILYNSKKYYLEKYMEINRMQKIIYNFLSKIGILEKATMYKINKILKIKDV